MTEYPTLFQPLTIAGHTLRNRICLPATVTNLAHNNRITEEYKNFLIERAKGGAGMLVTEVIAVDPNAIAQQGIVTGFDAANDTGFADLAARTKDEGAVLVGQLWHPGKQQLWGATSSPMGVSDQADAYSWTVPRVMTSDEITAVASAYVNVAIKLGKLGFAGVELHGAHGYLINQFLSPWSNFREDHWGGSVENRIRFAQTIARSIRNVAGPDFIIGLKMPGTEEVKGGIDAEEAARLTEALSVGGDFSYFAYGQGNFSLSLESHVPDLYYRPGHFLEIHKRMKQAAGGVPVMALGRIGSAAEAEAALADGAGDLIGMCRALIADPDLPAKAEAGNAATTRPTTFDNAAWGLVHAGRRLMDHLNPLIGQANESGWHPPEGNASKRIAVVGAGPAGLQAAWIAAARGHETILFGQSVGGGLAWEAKLPGRQDMSRITDWQLRMCDRYGVTMRLGKPATASDIKGEEPDVIILATGADQRQPEMELAPEFPVLSARDYARRGFDGPAGRAVVFDQDHSPAVYGLADALALNFADVQLLTPRPHFAQEVNYCSAIGVFRRLYNNGVTLIPAAWPVRAADRTVTWRNAYTASETNISNVDLFIYATPRSPRLNLLSELSDVDVVRVGDCQSPRPLMHAIHAGQAAALAI